ncbi:hypothetical protein Bhyg_08448 [Pseudolycoriella hygida]|uniref:Uncharacterized protein n=1 Tax=Pseudolycoriella hygida TaxID=35572 RepID=A0A9Q0N4T7_9DIPT|nr:hypothetical protein Bhyg_08448 [Pseudolycoriella hygida]
MVNPKRTVNSSSTKLTKVHAVPNCFMEIMRHSGILDPTSAAILEEWYDRILLDRAATPASCHRV